MSWLKRNYKWNVAINPTLAFNGLRKYSGVCLNEAYLLNLYVARSLYTVIVASYKARQWLQKHINWFSFHLWIIEHFNFSAVIVVSQYNIIYIAIRKDQAFYDLDSTFCTYSYRNFALIMERFARKIQWPRRRLRIPKNLRRNEP